MEGVAGDAFSRSRVLSQGAGAGGRQSILVSLGQPTRRSRTFRRARLTSGGGRATCMAEDLARVPPVCTSRCTTPLIPHSSSCPCPTLDAEGRAHASTLKQRGKKEGECAANAVFPTPSCSPRHAPAG